MSHSTTSVQVRKSEDRGSGNHGWLQSKHTFSFAGYYDPAQMGFRSLRVINQDRVEAGMGFSTHPHKDMEIFSYVLEGALEHKDSMGNGRVLEPGQIQLMSAGSGITHSEYNPSKSDKLHFLQIWIEPEKRGLEPTYTEWHPNPDDSKGKTLVISQDGRDGSAIIHQDAEVYRILLEPGQSVEHKLAEGRGVWMQVISGPVSFQDEVVESGDGASLEEQANITIKAQDEKVEALLFDLR